MTFRKHHKGKKEIQSIAYQSPRHVWKKQTLCLATDVLNSIPVNRLVEISSLEKEEWYEEISPVHDGLPPRFIAKAAQVGYVQHNHANDAKSTKRIKGMGTFFFHKSKKLLQS